MTAAIDPARRDRLHAAVADAFESQQVPWFAGLVNQPSHTYAREDTEAAARLVDTLAEALDLKVERHPDPAGKFADHRVYSTPATPDGARALVLAGHCDTVFPRAQGFLEFSREDGGSDTVRGPGVLDMKSGLSVIFFALRALREADPGLFARLRARVVVNTDEEVGSPSSHALYREVAARSSAALVFEGGRREDRIITARKGSGAFTLTAHGRDAHAGNEHANGRNAIHLLALLIPQVEGLTDYDAGTTVNVGLVEGGTAKNTVPGRASCVVDVRVTTQEGAERVESALRRLAEHPLAGQPEAVREHFAEARVELEGGMMRLPMEPTPESRDLCRRYEGHAAAAGLGVGEAPLQGGGSDANLLAAEGVPSIDGLGPFGQYFHSAREWSSLDSLRRRTQALACFLAEEARGT